MSDWKTYNRKLRRTTRLSKLAAHPRTSVAVLVRLATQPGQHEGVLATLLRSARLPAPVAEAVARERLLSLTHGWVIRQGIAGSRLVSLALLRQVAGRGEWYVAIELVHNPICPADVLSRYAQFHSDDAEEMKKWKEVIVLAKARLKNRPT